VIINAKGGSNKDIKEKGGEVVTKIGELKRGRSSHKDRGS